MNNDTLVRHFFGGFIRLHILYHAQKEDVYGVEMIRELRRHGYKLGPGTLYPILHNLHEGGLLTCTESVVAGKKRKNYRITKQGERLLADARARLRELFSEVVEDKDKMADGRKRTMKSNSR